MHNKTRTVYILFPRPSFQSMFSVLWGALLWNSTTSPDPKTSEETHLGLRLTPLLDIYSQTSLSTSPWGNPLRHFEVFI